VNVKYACGLVPELVHGKSSSSSGALIKGPEEGNASLIIEWHSLVQAPEGGTQRQRIVEEGHAECRAISK
jgi:hypothetical protein